MLIETATAITAVLIVGTGYILYKVIPNTLNAADNFIDDKFFKVEYITNQQNLTEMIGIFKILNELKFAYGHCLRMEIKNIQGITQVPIKKFEIVYNGVSIYFKIITDSAKHFVSMRVYVWNLEDSVKKLYSFLNELNDKNINNLILKIRAMKNNENVDENEKLIIDRKIVINDNNFGESDVDPHITIVGGGENENL